MSINRKNFLKTLGGVSLGLLAGPLVAGSGPSAVSSFALTGSEEKHLARFYDQLRTSSFPLSKNLIDGFRPARLLKRKARIRGHHFEYLAQNGSKVVMISRGEQLLIKTFQGA